MDKQSKTPMKAPSKEIKATLGEIGNDNGYTIPIELRVVAGGKAFIGERIRVKKGITEIPGVNLITGADGEIIYEHKEPASSAGKSIELIFQLTGADSAETRVTIPLPAVAEEKKRTEKSNDPEMITLTRHHMGGGLFAITIRVTKAGGVGVRVPVVIEYGGRQIEISTDEQGNVAYELPTPVLCGGVLEVRAIVSGIQDPAKLTLRMPRAPRPRATDECGGWLFGTNNGRAIFFIGIMIVLWSSCFLVGFGEPALSSTHIQLTEQQKIFNTMADGIDQSLIIKETGNVGNWQKWLWLGSLIWTIFTFVYTLLSLREEIADTTREWFEVIMNRSSTHSGDPLFEKIANWVGVQGVAKAKIEITKTESESAAGKGHLSFWDVLKSDMISEILIGLIPTLFRRVVSRGH